MKIIVSLTNGKQTYSEDVTENQKEYFEEASTNGANLGLTTFEHWVREIPEFELLTPLLNKYNTTDENAHFIFGWCESFFQSKETADWMYESDSCIRLSVKHEFERTAQSEMVENLVRNVGILS